MELVVKCVRLSPNPLTHHHALLLLSSAASLYPVCVYIYHLQHTWCISPSLLPSFSLFLPLSLPLPLPPFPSLPSCPFLSLSLSFSPSPSLSPSQSQVLHNIMPVFTFMGSNLLRNDDQYSFQIITQTIDSVIPPLIQVYMYISILFMYNYTMCMRELTCIVLYSCMYMYMYM